MLRDGSSSEQESLWSTAIYWSSELVQSIAQKRRETTLGEKIAYLKAEEWKRGCADCDSRDTVCGSCLHVRAEMRGNAFFHGSILEHHIISWVLTVIRKLERGGKKSAEGLVGMKYEMRQRSTAVTLRLSRLSWEDIRQLFRLEQIRFACCIQSSSYRGWRSDSTHQL